MKWNHKFKMLVLSLCVVAILGGCGSGQGSVEGNTTTSTQVPADQEIRECTLTVTNEAGTPMELVTVVIYEDAACTETVVQRVTNGEGKMSFQHTGPVDNCVAVIQNAPIGYAAEKSYPVSVNTAITLKAGAPLTEEHLNTTKRLLTLGDAMLDFEVTASDGQVFSLSQALQTHDAVLLNFWYMGCSPCKQEFPHLQEAYDQFEGKVAVIAMNPYDSDNASIEAFRQEQGYTFPMGKCDERWANIFDIESYPVSVVIDRYGQICLIHNGSADKAAFVNTFGFFAAEDYQQTFLRSISQLPDYES